MKIKFGNIGILSAALVFLPLVLATAQAGGELLWERFCGGEVVLTEQSGGVLVQCFATQPAPTPTPTSTTQPTPTDVPTPIPTPTGAPSDPYEGAPECATHDNREFHTIWNSQQGCHYNHTHGDSPHDVDDIFGTQVYAWTGGEISYPWQTFSSMGYENEVKHQGYVWSSRKPGDGSNIGNCINLFGDGCVKAFRAVNHLLMTDMEARTRFHSYWYEAQLCLESNPNDCGIVRFGGWQDTGDLLKDDIVIVDVPDRLTNSPEPRKLHYSALYSVWYPISAFGRISTAVNDSWGEVLLDDSDEFLFCYGEPGCKHNNSQIQPHLIGFQMGLKEYTSDGVIRLLTPYLDPDGDGRANVELRSDRYGRILVDANAQPILDCEIGLDCVPLVFENVSMSWATTNFQWRGDFREYDVHFGGETSGWIEYTAPMP